MKPPTKFELMRNNRLIASGRVAWDGLKQDVAVPTMEIDGVKYREHPAITGGDPCYGCWFSAAGRPCLEASKCGQLEFGGSCEERSVIYVKAA